jgi:antitoxin component YwqK of YwqJK toxin-antitoxin module
MTLIKTRKLAWIMREEGKRTPLIRIFIYKKSVRQRPAQNKRYKRELYLNQTAKGKILENCLTSFEGRAERKKSYFWF